MSVNRIRINLTFLKSFYYKEIQKEKKETGKVERALAIPDLMLGRYTVSLLTFGSVFRINAIFFCFLFSRMH